MNNPKHIPIIPSNVDIAPRVPVTHIDITISVILFTISPSETKTFAKLTMHP